LSLYLTWWIWTPIQFSIYKLNILHPLFYHVPTIKRKSNKKNKNASSKYHGVYFSKSLKSYVSMIRIGNKSKYIGLSKDEKVAAQLYNDFVIKNNLERDLNDI